MIIYSITSDLQSLDIFLLKPYIFYKTPFNLTELINLPVTFFTYF